MFFLYLSAIIQGISEAFPISSSAHMIAARLFFPHLYTQEAALFSASELQLLDIALHLGTVITILLYFRKDIKAVTQSGLCFITKARLCPNASPSLFTTLFYASLPTILCGALFSFLKWDQLARSPLSIAINCALFGVLFGLSINAATTSQKDTWPLGYSAFIIGCAQILALFPGVSRLGICTTAACFLGFTPWRAIRFSFLLGLISISGALCLKSITAPAHFFESLDIALLTKALALSTILSLVCLRLLDRMAQYPKRLWLFAVYRLLLGALLICFSA